MANTLLTIPVNSFPHFDELYVISDLHLGGPSNFQIFNSGDELARLITHLAGLLPEKKIALLINGDFVDFLAEEPSRHFDPEGAVGKLSRIATEDTSFVKVFEALRGFANTKNRRLIINLGNHDLELALPWVRSRLMEILSGGNDEACGRITCAFDGTGFGCRVGNATVLCVHGNEVDTWNLADYEKIRRFGLEVTHGRPIDSWIPNAGTQLVIDVMNDLKRKYPFIDLLKPENEAVLPTIFALAPDQRDKLAAFGATLARRVWDTARHVTGFLGDSDLQGRTLAAADVFVPGPNYLSDFGNSRRNREYTEKLLALTEKRFDNEVDPMALIGVDEAEGYLGMFSAAIKFFRGEEISEVLREALSDLREDRTFEPDTEDQTFRSLDKEIGEGFDFLIAGHTHLARALPRRQKSGWYFNSGTWARLVKLNAEVLDDAEKFKVVFETFKQGTMQALDSLPNLVIRKLSVVVIRADGDRTHGELREVNLSPEGDVLPEDGYRFTKN